MGFWGLKLYRATTIPDGIMQLYTDNHGIIQEVIFLLPDDSSISDDAMELVKKFLTGKHKDNFRYFYEEARMKYQYMANTTDFTMPYYTNYFWHQLLFKAATTKSVRIDRVKLKEILEN